MKTSNLSADNFDLDGSTPEPSIRSSDTSQRMPGFDSFQLITTLMSKYVYYYTLVPCGADGQAVYGHILPNFLGWVDFLSYGAPPTNAQAREWSPAVKC